MSDRAYIDTRSDLDARAIGRGGEVALDDSRSGRHFRECLASVRAGFSYEKHCECLDDELAAYAEERRGNGTKGEHDWKRALAHCEADGSTPVDARDAFDDLGDDEHEPRAKRQFITAAELSRHPRPHDFVEGLLYEGCLSVWAGAPKSGKTFLMLSVAMAVATGAPWAGRAVDKANVLVIPLEGVGLLYPRLRALEIKTGKPSPIYLSPSPLNLLKAKRDIDEIVAFAKSHAVKLIILDTLARATAGAKESSFEDMSRAIAALDRIKDESGAHVAVVHHAGYSRAGPRGSSDIVAAPDLIVEISREGDQRQARIAENRHGKDGEVLRFTLETVVTDLKTSRGKPMDSAVATLSGEWFDDLDAGKSEAPNDGLSERARAALSLARDLVEVAELCGQRASEADWRAAFYAVFPNLSGEGRKKAFDRARNAVSHLVKVKAGELSLL